MRGRRVGVKDLQHIAGNTPAYAGKTDPTSWKFVFQEKHPRVCGEDSSSQSDHTLEPETPPRMRGRRL